jgi:hypothetical protein
MSALGLLDVLIRLHPRCYALIGFGEDSVLRASSRTARVWILR